MWDCIASLGVRRKDKYGVVLYLLFNMKGFFSWFDIRNFLDVPQEWHAMIEGIAEGITLGKLKYEPTRRLRRDLRKEHHYYAAGAGIGIIILIFSIAGAVRLVLEAVL